MPFGSDFSYHPISILFTGSWSMKTVLCSVLFGLICVTLTGCSDEVSQPKLKGEPPPPQDSGVVKMGGAPNEKGGRVLPAKKK